MGQRMTLKRVAIVILGVGALWWSNGWGTITKFDLAKGLFGAPRIHLFDMGRCGGNCIPCVPPEQAGGKPCEFQPGTLAYDKAGEWDLWRLWFYQRWSNGDLPLYLFFPFVAGFFGVAIYWSANRFREEKPKAVTDTQADPPTGELL